MPETQNQDRDAERPPSAGSVAEQAAKVRTCDATLEQLDKLLAGLAGHRLSARGAIQARRLVDTLRRGLVYEFPVLTAEQALDELIAADGWTHPTQALETATRDWGLLLRVCEERMEGTKGAERARLADVRDKLAAALRLDEEAEAARYQRKLDELQRRRGATAAEGTQPGTEEART